jgi:DVNP family
MTGNFKKTIGTRAEVWHGTAKKTSGGLQKDDLLQNKSGRIVSKAKHHTAKKEMRLKKFGFGPKSRKEMLKLSKKNKSRKASRKMRGGAGMGSLSPADANASYMIKDVTAQQFSPLDRALTGGRRRRARSMRGGAMALSPADANASYMIKDVTAQQFSPLDRALTGGRRRARSMKGGVGKMVGAANHIEPAPLQAALNA